MQREPVEPRGRRFIAAKTQEAPEMIGDRGKARVLKTLRAAPLDDRRLLPPRNGLSARCGHLSAPLFEHELLDGVHEARLAQTRLADQQYHLAHPFLGLLPAIF